jgi:hypothetical protein
MKKHYYLSPRVTFTEVDQEGLICASPIFNVQVKELKNMNDPVSLEEDEELEEFYFKS